jgi:hypothetical protein
MILAPTQRLGKCEDFGDFTAGSEFSKGLRRSTSAASARAAAAARSPLMEGFPMGRSARRSARNGRFSSTPFFWSAGNSSAFSPDIDIVDVKVSLLSYSNPGRWEKVETAKPTNLVAVRDVNILMYDDVYIIISLYGGVHKWGYP